MLNNKGNIARMSDNGPARKFTTLFIGLKCCIFLI